MVDYNTWYEISNIYVAVTRIAGACLIGLKENSAGKRKNDVILYKIKVTIQNPMFQIKKENSMNTETPKLQDNCGIRRHTLQRLAGAEIHR